jgi:hypothetical protein
VRVSVWGTATPSWYDADRQGGLLRGAELTGGHHDLPSGGHQAHSPARNAGQAVGVGGCAERPDAVRSMLADPLSVLLAFVGMLACGR